MKRKNLLLLACIAFVGLSQIPSPCHPVKWVCDGDTICLKDGRMVRYLGIDAPEIGHNGGKSEYMALASKAFNQQLTGKAKVRLEFDRERNDRYGRLLAYVYLENGEMANAVMLRKGLAFVMLKRPNLMHFPLLLENQREAMRKRIGIWKGNPAKPEKGYLGNSQSHRFHRPTCPFSKNIRANHLVHFKSRKDAFWEGYSPCRTCKP